MLAAVPGCVMCVSAFERGFEPSASKLMWGEVKRKPTAGPAPHETADPVLEVSPVRWSEDVLSALPGTALKRCRAGVLLVGVFGTVAAPSPRAFSEEDAQLLF